MAKSLYVISAEGSSGKSTVALGALEMLLRLVPTVGVFRPVTKSKDAPDHVLDNLLSVASASIPRDQCVGVTYDDVHADPDLALARIVTAFAECEAKCDAVVVLGSDFTDVATPTELGFNARVAANIGAPVLFVLGGRSANIAAETLGQSSARTASDLAQIAHTCAAELEAHHASLVAVFVNRADPQHLGDIERAVSHSVASSARRQIPVWVIPENRILVAPSVEDVRIAVHGTLLRGDPELLAREALDVTVADMDVEHMLGKLTEGAVIVIAADRVEMMLAVVSAHESGTYPSLAAIILSGDFPLPANIDQLLGGVDSRLPIIRTTLSTYQATRSVTHLRGTLTPESPRKFDIARSLFADYVDSDELARLVKVHVTDSVTPLMFTHTLFERAKRANAHIVLPEGDDERILRAASSILTRAIARLTILGDAKTIRRRAGQLGLNLEGANIVDPVSSAWREEFVHTYATLRAHKGCTVDDAKERMLDVSYFGTMMVHLGLADGMVSGASHTTAHTIRPSLEIIRTRPGVSLVSSVFFMLLADRVLVYGDCAINEHPSAAQLADIALSSAHTAKQFGVDPRVAMLSYSTGDSGSGDDVELVREATQMVRAKDPALIVEGPIQYDAATDPTVAATKLPGSRLAGNASVFIFPDLNTGNNTYKAVQRSAGALAVGPILQGLNKPVNDLSRGASVDDIVSTVAITAIQTQTDEPMKEQHS